MHSDDLICIYTFRSRLHPIYSTVVNALLIRAYYPCHMHILHRWGILQLVSKLVSTHHLAPGILFMP